MPDHPDQPGDMAGGIPLAGPVRVAPGDLTWQFTCSSGPGGQNVNKRATRAELRVHIRSLIGLPAPAAARLAGIASVHLCGDGELRIVCQTTRSQGQNREAALATLRQLIATALVRPKHRRPTRPSRGAKERRLESKRHTSQRKAERRGE